jgi:hypothetical protein
LGIGKNKLKLAIDWHSSALLFLSKVTLKIFNILGKEVTKFIFESLSAGSYSYEWDASSLASGVYLYRREADGFVQTRKITLMK